MTRWVVTEGEAFSGRRVYKVRRPEWPTWQTISVWADPGQPTSARCVECSGPLRAMLATCKHEMAVRRFLRRPPTGERRDD